LSKTGIFYSKDVASELSDALPVNYIRLLLFYDFKKIQLEYSKNATPFPLS
jgi:hypothetical protein